MSDKKTKEELEKELAGAVVLDPVSGAVCGHRVVGPSGHMVLGKGISLAVSLERGYYVDGLKDGFRLADAKEEAALLAAVMKAKAPPAKPEKPAEKSPK